LVACGKSDTGAETAELQEPRTSEDSGSWEKVRGNYRGGDELISNLEFIIVTHAAEPPVSGRG
jgi:hypothetical protein